MYRHLDERNWHHRSRFNNFVNVLRWDPQEALRAKAYEMVKMLKPKSNETILLILDDSKKHKRGKAMQAVGWVKDPLSGKTMRGHQYVTATLWFRGYTIPFGIRLYIKKEDCPGLNRSF